ncbi:hypothetical protein PORCRE_919 [Porphyromonas crevioricanis JCM 15906]|uniref:Uncharacterized protein n=1 Tax=Porphyromonas crevioricanis JCM 15906 TaxID=1305617 RepID=T1DSD0_9PORP|nr:hypothetical protein PORCRE_919 [Porphyromonas crevioricanis JCM 15906]
MQQVSIRIESFDIVRSGSVLSSLSSLLSQMKASELDLIFPQKQ